MIYLDDGICCVPADRAKDASELLKIITLEQAGFVAHLAKSQWTPSFEVLWLGFHIDLLNGVILVPKAKVKAINNLVGLALKQEVLKERFLASIVGKIISLSLAVCPVA